MSEQQYREIQAVADARGISASDVIRERSFRETTIDMRLRSLEARMSAAETWLNSGWVAQCEVAVDPAPLLMMQEGA